jgi:hypothetical protein
MNTIVQCVESERSNPVVTGPLPPVSLGDGVQMVVESAFGIELIETWIRTKQWPGYVAAIVADPYDIDLFDEMVEQIGLTENSCEIGEYVFVHFPNVSQLVRFFEKWRGVARMYGFSNGTYFTGA